jgi:hypothetical protein
MASIALVRTLCALHPPANVADTFLQASTRSRSAACASCAIARSVTCVLGTAPPGCRSPLTSSLAQERNFERKIKYSCRKVLADSRPRVRGRFAKNDDNAAPKLDADDFDFMDDVLEDEHSGDQPGGGVFEAGSGASTTGRSGGEERQSALASVFPV